MSPIETPADSPAAFECRVVCSCGETVEIGTGSSEAMAAFDAGRHAQMAFEHTRRGHNLRLVIARLGRLTDDIPIPVCLIHGEPMTLWNGHPFCPACDARDDDELSG